MQAWLKYFALMAASSFAAMPAAAQSDVLLEPVQVVSAAQDCMSSFKKFEIDPKLLKARGWRELKVAADDLDGLMKAYLRADGTLMLTLRYSCIVKARMSPASRDNLEAVASEHFGTKPSVTSGGEIMWSFQGYKIELTPGPADGSQVNLSVRTF